MRDTSDTRVRHFSGGLSASTQVDGNRAEVQKKRHARTATPRAGKIAKVLTTVTHHSHGCRGSDRRCRGWVYQHSSREGTAGRMDHTRSAQNPVSPRQSDFPPRVCAHCDLHFFVYDKAALHAAPKILNRAGYRESWIFAPSSSACLFPWFSGSTLPLLSCSGRSWRRSSCFKLPSSSPPHRSPHWPARGLLCINTFLRAALARSHVRRHRSPAPHDGRCRNRSVRRCRLSHLHVRHGHDRHE